MAARHDGDVGDEEDEHDEGVGGKGSPPTRADPGVLRRCPGGTNAHASPLLPSKPACGLGGLGGWIRAVRWVD